MGSHGLPGAVALHSPTTGCPRVPPLNCPAHRQGSLPGNPRRTWVTDRAGPRGPGSSPDASWATLAKPPDSPAPDSSSRKQR